MQPANVCCALPSVWQPHTPTAFNSVFAGSFHIALQAWPRSVLPADGGLIIPDITSYECTQFAACVIPSLKVEQKESLTLKHAYHSSKTQSQKQTVIILALFSGSRQCCVHNEPISQTFKMTTLIKLLKFQRKQENIFHLLWSIFFLYICVDELFHVQEKERINTNTYTETPQTFKQSIFIFIF